MQIEKLLDNYARGLGNVIGNLHSLELILRLFLHKVDLDRYGSPQPRVDLDKMEEGDFIQENYFTNYDSLDKLVNKYNEIITSRKSSELSVDKTTVKLRDAFAHGRVFGSDPRSSLKLYKFSKPSKKALVKVEHIANLTGKELDKYILHLRAQIEKVEEACKKFCPEIIG